MCLQMEILLPIKKTAVIWPIDNTEETVKQNHEDTITKIHIIRKTHEAISSMNKLEGKKREGNNH